MKRYYLILGLLVLLLAIIGYSLFDSNYIYKNGNDIYCLSGYTLNLKEDNMLNSF